MVTQLVLAKGVIESLFTTSPLKATDVTVDKAGHVEIHTVEKAKSSDEDKNLHATA